MFFAYVKAKELYLYSPIYSFVAESLIAQMEDNSENDVTLRVNCPGGSVLSGWGVIAKMRERKEVKTNIKVDGSAMSMACYMLAYATGEVECLDVSRFMLHPADMYVSDETDQAFLDGMNKDLRACLEAKIDSEKLKKFTGYSIADMFENKDCPDLFLTAKQAKALGLVTKINKLNTDEAKAINEKMFAVAAEEPKEIQVKNNNKMEIKTLADLKAQLPTVYAEAVKEGVDAEFSRVNSFNVFRGVDAKAVDAAIKERKPFTTDFQSEMLLKAASAKALNTLEQEAAPGVTTEETSATSLRPDAKAKAEAIAKFEQSVDKAYADRTGKTFGK